MRRGSRRYGLKPAIALLLGCWLAWGPGRVLAQSGDGAAAADSLAAAADTSTTTMSAMEKALAEATTGSADAQATTQVAADAGPFFVSLKNAPKAGAKANVRQFTYYGELVTDLKFRRNSSVKNNLGWSWEDYRKQDKTVERWDNVFSYQLGQMLPLTTKLDATWNWSEDKTTNTAGVANVSARDQKRIQFSGFKSNFATGSLVNIARFSAGVTDLRSVNLNQNNDVLEGLLDANWQSSLEITEGVAIAGRVYGQVGQGERSLSGADSPSSAQGDTVGFGVYYDRSTANGRVSIARSNFRKKYLDFKKNTNGLIDTVGIDEANKVVQELETKDALGVELVNNFRVGRLGFNTRLTRDTEDQDYAASGIGLRERYQDMMDLGLTFAVGRDSFSVNYNYVWRWDDQQFKGATSPRGRQYTKDRDYDFNYTRRFFKKTDLSLRYHQGLIQDIAQNQHNENDKDRLQTDFSAKLERNWVGKFRANMVYSFGQIQDLSIRSTRSSNNNERDSYEISPGYGWDLAPWLSLDQSYRVYIQYTDYDYSDLASATRQDNYNKRGNLATRVNIRPTSRLELKVRHDYNKRFSATKLGVSSTGDPFYNRDENQTISKIDLGFRFEAVPGVTLEGATYRTRDKRVTFGQTEQENINFSGEMWVGTVVRQKWGKQNPVELYAMVRKYNAFGPSVTETSADYWEADAWLKWEF